MEFASSTARAMTDATFTDKAIVEARALPTIPFLLYSICDPRIRAQITASIGRQARLARRLNEQQAQCTYRG